MNVWIALTVANEQRRVSKANIGIQNVYLVVGTFNRTQYEPFGIGKTPSKLFINWGTRVKGSTYSTPVAINNTLANITEADAVLARYEITNK